jgi:type I restriction-modification system, S subunit
MTPEQLKNSILQLAIQGKLVEQRKEEGTSEELFKEIQEEKQKLIEERKLKKQKVLPDITDDEIPFEIPETWKWVRLGEIGDWGSGATPSRTNADFYGGNIPWLKTGDLTDSYIFDVPECITKIALEKTSVRLNPKGSILIAMYGATIGKLGILTKAMTTNQACCACIVFPSVYNLYLFYFLFANRTNFVKQGEGGAQPNISKDKIINTLIPLPPLAEQTRIVEKIEELLPLVDRYEKAWTRLEELNKKFPLDIQKSILQEAIQGKLVEQRKEEGTGEELYKEIQEEKLKLIEEGKLKKQKSLPKITEDEIPFDIPETWKWVRLRDICTKIVDGDHNPPAGIKTETNYWMLSAININNGSLSELDRVRYLTKEVFENENERTKVKPGDIFFTIVATLGRSCVYEGGYNICFQRSVSVITTLIYNYYLKYALDSGFIQQFMIANATGTAQKGFYLNQVEKLLIPLPPLAEQKRIVEKIEELLPLCERLK